MLSAHWGKVSRIIAEREGATEVTVEFPDAPHLNGPALAYSVLTGPLAVGDRVLVNTLAVELHLGTGGQHFIMAVEGREPRGCGDPGSVVKLRYTPLQHAVHSVEESDTSQTPGSGISLEGVPVIATELHSQLPAVAAGIRAALPQARIVYVMPDSAALPLALSRLVPALRESGLIQCTITCGQAFGGDLEAVSLPSALAAAQVVAGADAIIVAQGPGNAGTGTPLGFSGIAQAEWLHAAHSLQGTAIAAVRVSFADARPRHYGLSHHTLTILGQFVLCPVVVPLPNLPPEESLIIGRQLAALAGKHILETHDGEPALALLKTYGIMVTTMSRSIEQERSFFLAAGAAGAAAAARLSQER